MPRDSRECAVLVLCPMRIEHDAVSRAVRAHGLARVRVVQTGIGKDAILRTLEREIAAVDVKAIRGLVLAGACGGLVSTVDVPPIAAVIDTHGGRWLPRIGAVESGVTLVAVDHVVATPSDKRELARTTGASIVDMESHAFARRCETLGVRWGVVRGVSDTPDETLPSEVLGWVTPEGETRSMRAAADLALKPRLIPHIAGVLKRSRRDLPQVGHRVCELAELLTRESGS